MAKVDGGVQATDASSPPIRPPVGPPTCASARQVSQPASAEGADLVLPRRAATEPTTPLAPLLARRGFHPRGGEHFHPWVRAFRGARGPPWMVTSPKVRSVRDGSPSLLSVLGILCWVGYEVLRRAGDLDRDSAADGRLCLAHQHRRATAHSRVRPRVHGPPRQNEPPGALRLLARRRVPCPSPGKSRSVRRQCSSGLGGEMDA